MTWWSRRRRSRSDVEITALARALFEVGLTTVGPDDLDNRQIASRLLARRIVKVRRRSL